MKAYEAPALERIAVEVVNALLTSGSGMTDGGTGKEGIGDVVFSVKDKLNIFG